MSPHRTLNASIQLDPDVGVEVEIFFSQQYAPQVTLVSHWVPSSANENMLDTVSQPHHIEDGDLPSAVLFKHVFLFSRRFRRVSVQPSPTT